MSEEIQNEAPAQEPPVSADSEVKTDAPAEVTQTSVEPVDEDKEIVNPLTGEVIRPAKQKESSRTRLLCRFCVARCLEFCILLFAGHYHYIRCKPHCPIDHVCRMGIQHHFEFRCLAHFQAKNQGIRKILPSLFSTLRSMLGGNVYHPVYYRLQPDFRSCCAPHRS